MITGSRVQSGLTRLEGGKSDSTMLEGFQGSWHFSTMGRKQL